MDVGRYPGVMARPRSIAIGLFSLRRARAQCNSWSVRKRWTCETGEKGARGGKLVVDKSRKSRVSRASRRALDTPSPLPQNARRVYLTKEQP